MQRKKEGNSVLSALGVLSLDNERRVYKEERRPGFIRAPDWVERVGI